MYQEAVIVAYGRSPIGKARKGFFAATHPVDLGGKTLAAVLQRVPELPLEDIDDVIVGCAITNGPQGNNLGRLISTRAGLPDCVSAATINRFCSSGLQAIAMGANAITTCQADVVVAGGVESMSLAPMGGSPETNNEWLMEHRPGAYLPMGLTAENVADAYHVTRTSMDQMAVESHAKAWKAQESGAFEREIVPITITDASGTEKTVTKDEGIRPGSSLESLAQLTPCFKEDGIVTAATSSQTSDGSAFVVLMSAEKANALSLTPLAKMHSFAVAGVPCEIMGTGPIYAVPKALKQANLSLTDMDVIELNEAFAAQAIPCIKELKLPPEKVNPRGGALALGHPMGATGAILTSKALSYLEDTGGRYALSSMCIGGGMGAAAVFERL